MARFARIIHPHTPYHITHRGNRKSPVFITDEVREDYLADLGRCAAKAEWLAPGLEDHTMARLRRAASSGRPYGSEGFVTQVEAGLGRKMSLKCRERPPKIRGETD